MTRIYIITIAALALAASQFANAQDDIGQTEIAVGGLYKSETTLSDNGSTVIAEDIVTLSTTLSKEKEIASQGNLSIYLEGEASALYGQARNVIVDGVDINQSATYRAAEAFGNVKIEQDLGDDWMAFSKAGVGVLYEELSTDGFLGEQQKFRDLSPAGQFQAGVEKKVNDKLSIGVAAGTTEKFD